MRDTGSADVFKVAVPSRPRFARPRFARIAAFDRILRRSQAPTQLPQPRRDHALRAAPNALVRAAVAKAQAKNSDSNSDRQNSNDCLRLMEPQEGGRKPLQVIENVTPMSAQIPADFWSALKREGLIAEKAPTLAQRS